MPKRPALVVLLAALLPVSAHGIAGTAGGPVPDPAVDSTARRGDAYFHLIRSRLAAGQGRLSEALAEMREAIETAPESAELRGESAALLLHLGKESEAEEEAKLALAIDPSESSALRVAADLDAHRALSPEGDPEARDRAIALYGEISRRKDADDEIFPVLARLRALASDPEGAVAAARSFADRRPGDSAAARLLAQYLERDGRKDEALEVLVAFYATNPDAEEILTTIGDLARETGRWDPVVAACSRVLDAEPNRPAPRALRGEALLRLGREVEAVSDFESLRDLVPDNRLAMFQLATAYGEVGRLADAVEIARRLAAELPGHSGIQSFLGEMLGRQGDLEGAGAAFRSAIAAIREGEPEGGERRDGVRRRMASLLLERSRVAEAERVARELEAPEAAESLELLGRIALASQDGARTREIARKLRDRGGDGIAALLEAESWVLEGRADRARVRFGEAESLLGPGVREEAAVSWASAGRPDEAERVLRAWALREPQSARVRFRLGALLDQERRYTEAEAELRAALRIEPGNANVLNYLGYSLADRGVAVEEALGLIRRAVASEPWNAAYLDSLGWALYRLGRFEEARVPIERASRDYPFDPTVLEHLGDVYRRLGEPEKARAMWRRSLEAGSENADAIREKLASGLPAEGGVLRGNGDGRGAPPPAGR